MIQLLQIFAAALFNRDLPESQRVEQLRQYFDPPIGTELRLDDDEIRDYASRRKSTVLRGFVRVKPPQGSCFTVQRSDEIPDETICKDQNLSFQLSDLRHDGTLQWLIKTGDGDFGTKIKWKTPYRLVLSVPYGKSLDVPERRFLRACEAQRLPDGERRVLLRFVGGGIWALKFPSQDGLVPNQPTAISNLGTLEPAASLPPAPSSSNGHDSPSSATAENKGTSGDHSATPSASDKKAAPNPASGPSPEQLEEAEEAKWHIPKRGAFMMSAENFMPFGSVSPGIKGLCRYRYVGDDVDPTTPLVECRDADGFEQVIIPVVCLIKP